jgi:hypothetical protein
MVEDSGYQWSVAFLEFLYRINGAIFIESLINFFACEAFVVNGLSVLGGSDHDTFVRMVIINDGTVLSHDWTYGGNIRTRTLWVRRT